VIFVRFITVKPQSSDVGNYRRSRCNTGNVFRTFSAVFIFKKKFRANEHRIRWQCCNNQSSSSSCIYAA